jgi:hypothetical protein
VPSALYRIHQDIAPGDSPGAFLTGASRKRRNCRAKNPRGLETMKRIARALNDRLFDADARELAVR